MCRELGGKLVADATAVTSSSVRLCCRHFAGNEVALTGIVTWLLPIKPLQLILKVNSATLNFDNRVGDNDKVQLFRCLFSVFR